MRNELREQTAQIEMRPYRGQQETLKASAVVHQFSRTWSCHSAWHKVMAHKTLRRSTSHFVRLWTETVGTKPSDPSSCVRRSLETRSCHLTTPRWSTVPSGYPRRTSYETWLEQYSLRADSDDASNWELVDHLCDHRRVLTHTTEHGRPPGTAARRNNPCGEQQGNWWCSGEECRGFRWLH